MKRWWSICIFLVVAFAAGCRPTRHESATALNQEVSPQATPEDEGGSVATAPAREPRSAGTNSTTVPGDVEVSPEPLVEASISPQPTSTSNSKATVATTPPPAIDYFRSDRDLADPGETITLDWSTSQAITVTLYRLLPTGQLGRFWDVSPAGTLDYTIGEHERNATRFALYAAGTDGDLVTATLSVELRCEDAWFFADHPPICPASAPLSSGAAVQNFERGTMVWVEAEDQVYVLFADGRSPGWNRYVDQWDPGQPDHDPAIIAPAGWYQPVRGFGLLWREEPGLRDRLGWAVVEEAGYSTVVQRTSYAKYNETYLLADDGGIWRLLPERSAWEKMAGSNGTP